MLRSSVRPSRHLWIATLDVSILPLVSQVKDRQRPTQRHTPLELEVIFCVCGVISPVLANITLDGLEAVVYASVGSTKLSRTKAQLNVIRYADDFVVTGISKEVLEAKVLPAIEAFMAERGLELSREKTRITHVEQGFDFLGQNVRKYNGKLLIKPATKRESTSRQGSGNCQEACQCHTGDGNQIAQPAHPGLGNVPPPRRGQSVLHDSRPSRLAPSLEVGTTAPSCQRFAVGPQAILPSRWRWLGHSPLKNQPTGNPLDSVSLGP